MTTPREDHNSHDEAGAQYWAQALGRDEAFGGYPLPGEFEES